LTKESQVSKEINDAMRRAAGRRSGWASGADLAPGSTAMNARLRDSLERKTKVPSARKEEQ
jgi:hypothetical protein